MTVISRGDDSLPVSQAAVRPDLIAKTAVVSGPPPRTSVSRKEAPCAN